MKDKINPNGNIILNNNEKESMILNISEKFKDIIDILKLDLDSEQIIETPQRVAKMYVEELFSGCYSLEPKITVFPNTKKYDEIIISGPIKVKSMCSHHFMPFFGYAYVGYIPKDKVIGISKFSRIVNWLSRRPQIQEELTEQIADYIEEKLNPNGVIVFIKAKHFCMIHRGANEEQSDMITSVTRGFFRDSHTAKTEFFSLINNGKEL